MSVDFQQITWCYSQPLLRRVTIHVYDLFVASLLQFYHSHSLWTQFDGRVIQLFQEIFTDLGDTCKISLNFRKRSQLTVTWRRHKGCWPPAGSREINWWWWQNVWMSQSARPWYICRWRSNLEMWIYKSSKWIITSQNISHVKTSWKIVTINYFYGAHFFWKLTVNKFLTSM
jgi:hypothetical protein